MKPGWFCCLAHLLSIELRPTLAWLWAVFVLSGAVAVSGCSDNRPSSGGEAEGDTSSAEVAATGHQVAPPSATAEEALQRFTSARDYRYLLGVYDQRTCDRLQRFVKVVEQCRKVDDELDRELVFRFGTNSDPPIVAQGDESPLHLLAVPAPRLYHMDVKDRRTLENGEIEFVLADDTSQLTVVAVEEDGRWRIRPPPWQYNPAAGLEIYERYVACKKQVVAELISGKFSSPKAVAEAFVRSLVEARGELSIPEQVVARYEANVWVFGAPKGTTGMWVPEAVAEYRQRQRFALRRYKAYNSFYSAVAAAFGPRWQRYFNDSTAHTDLGLASRRVVEKTKLGPMEYDLTIEAVFVDMWTLTPDRTLTSWRIEKRQEDGAWAIDDRPRKPLPEFAVEQREKHRRDVRLLEQLARDVRRGRYHSARAVYDELRRRTARTQP